jgi:hypothetical protein
MNTVGRGPPMPDLEPLYLMLTPDLERLLADREIDLNELIRQADPNIRIEMGHNPAAGDTAEKELVTILLASAVVVSALMPTLKELIRAATNRPIVVTDLSPTPLLDGSGKPILQANGEPAVAWAKTTRDLNPNMKLKVKGFGIEFSIGEQ